MRVNLFRYWLLLILICLLSAATAFSQQSDPLGIGVPVSIVRKAKPDRRATHKAPKPVERAPLLKLEWRLNKVSADGSDGETPQRTFRRGDRLRLSVRTNQDGYLYVVHQKSPDSPGVVIFPDSRINYGDSRIDKSEEFVLPSNCPIHVARRDCAVVLTFSGDEELFHLFFTREPFSKLPGSASEAVEAIPAEVLKSLEGGSGQILRRQKGSTEFSELLTNINTNDNEDIMETIILKRQ